MTVLRSLINTDEDWRAIPLTDGYFAIVDAADYEFLSKRRWQADTRGRTVYAVRIDRVDGKQRKIRMHRLIMNAPVGSEVDHADGNGLNNRRGNLRFCGHQENCGNARCRSTSGFKGVTKDRRKWRAQCGDQHLGMFDNREEAARAYDVAASKRYGSFARLNFPVTT